MPTTRGKARPGRRGAWLPGPALQSSSRRGISRRQRSVGTGPARLTQSIPAEGDPADTSSCMTPPAKPVRPGRDRPTTPRLLRELETIEAMAVIYCRDHHHTSQPCADCRALMTYAARRLAVCTYGEDKPVCAKCQVHCYGKVMRERVREVMRYSGPRMIWRHPWLALMHVVDKRHAAPPKPNAAARAAEPPPAPPNASDERLTEDQPPRELSRAG